MVMSGSLAPWRLAFATHFVNNDYITAEIICGTVHAHHGVVLYNYDLQSTCVHIMAVCVCIMAVCVYLMAVCVCMMAVGVCIMAVGVCIMAVCVYFMAVCVYFMAVLCLRYAASTCSTMREHSMASATATVPVRRE